MKCENCPYKDIASVPNEHAFDVPDKTMIFYKDVDYCTEHSMPCDDAYLNCPYREITVEAQHIQLVIGLLKSHTEHPKIFTAGTAIEQLNKILFGEDLT
ncbi:MAG: hypothetical protein A2Y62_21185 [Candidatus Fischerbacteria bacterium RBG_13_37_8]|uniref:Uncharacterized protein n=1 Tax=Candidatus Fischerbacteria bacterium RBG_13_37_8 TaxID=1817863 RepID=A0A1F5V4X4_9BACT|nr:MAG: hypothetical protein A2Y62_21185 [Candidatus Fischerbacteria bacterium RBG_13_37_8]